MPCKKRCHSEAKPKNLIRLEEILHCVQDDREGVQDDEGGQDDEGDGKTTFKELVQELFVEVDEADIDKNGKWKQVIIKKFETYDGFFPKNKVNLKTDKPQPR